MFSFALVMGCFTVVIGSGGANMVAAACQSGSALGNMPSLPPIPSTDEIQALNDEISDATAMIPEVLEDKNAELAWLQDNGGTQAEIDAVQQEIDDLSSVI